MAMTRFIQLYDRKYNERQKFSFAELINELNQLTPNKKLEKIGLCFDQENYLIINQSKEIRDRSNDLNSSSLFLMQATNKAYKNVAECCLEIEKNFFKNQLTGSLKAGLIDFNYG
ncbi:unnamed protein product [Brachionus calyciflorus]|uniref:Uncharacterized protein n=1 Tax=Brachionus calyciflorus TaxID=104777 RepID=A0A813YG19_9BILA|nr:unnamed protein product [Brachionus calyciflorus]